MFQVIMPVAEMTNSWHLPAINQLSNNVGICFRITAKSRFSFPSLDNEQNQIGYVQTLPLHRIDLRFKKENQVQKLFQKKTPQMSEISY